LILTTKEPSPTGGRESAETMRGTWSKSALLPERERSSESSGATAPDDHERLVEGVGTARFSRRQ
jgi:hypothetical protein